ncbi:MAG: DUF2175 family protein [Sulfolobales archaeon]
MIILNTKYKTWKCGLCGENVIEGQRFLFLRNLGFVHLECLIEKLSEKNLLNRDIIALIDSNEVVTYSIIRLKQAEIMSSDNKIKEIIMSLRKELEKRSAVLSSELERFL